VLGKPPLEGVQSVIPLWLLEKSQANYEVSDDEGRLHLGIDPARFGDDKNGCFPRRGYRLFEPEPITKGDGAELARQVMQIVRKLRRRNDEATRRRTHFEFEVPIVKVDGIGVGATLVDHLKPFTKTRHVDGKRIPPEIALVVVISSEKADDEVAYHNKRTELHFTLQKWMKEGGALPAHEDLERGLLAVRYEFDAKNRLKVESKDDIKERIGMSPDDADAAMLAVYMPKVFRDVTNEPEAYVPEASDFDSTPIGF
jgi:hypothetical protein